MILLGTACPKPKPEGRERAKRGGTALGLAPGGGGRKTGAMTEPATETERNRRLVTEAFQRFVAGDQRPFWDLVADDVRWTVIGSTDISGTFQSKQAFFDNATSKLVSGLDGPLLGSVRNVLADGDHVVVQWESSAPTKNGGRYEQTYCWVLGLEDGRVVDTVAYLDTEMVSSVFA